MADISRKIRFVIDINAPLYPRTMPGVLMEGDKKADVLEIAFKDGDTAVKASDVVQVANALVTNMDGQTLLNAGTVGDMISITLKDECYAVPGKVTIDVNVQRSGVERTILTISADVYPNGRGIVIDASGALPSYGDLLIIKQEMQQATAAANTAATSANAAATNANQKANAANTAAGAANTAASTANTAANRANNAAAEVEGSVRYNAAQTLSDAQKQQARYNILAAPDGYGLGATVGKTITDANDGIRNGWYYLSGNSANNPFAGYGCVFRVDSIGTGNLHQEFYNRATGEIVHRCYISGTWGEFEWENPPLMDGVEYRTTERWNGKAVYTKLFDCGLCPNNAVKTVNIGLPASVNLLRLIGSVGNDGTIPYYRGGNFIYIVADHVKIYITTNFDASVLNAKVCLYYTKD